MALATDTHTRSGFILRSPERVSGKWEFSKWCVETFRNFGCESSTNRRLETYPRTRKPTIHGHFLRLRKKFSKSRTAWLPGEDSNSEMALLFSPFETTREIRISSSISDPEILRHGVARFRRGSSRPIETDVACNRYSQTCFSETKRRADCRPTNQCPARLRSLLDICRNWEFCLGCETPLTSLTGPSQCQYSFWYATIVFNLRLYSPVAAAPPFEFAWNLPNLRMPAGLLERVTLIHCGRVTFRRVRSDCPCMNPHSDLHNWFCGTFAISSPMISTIRASALPISCRLIVSYRENPPDVSARTWTFCSFPVSASARSNTVMR